MAKEIQKPPFKEGAGVLCAFLVVLAFVAIGFATMTCKVVLGIDVTVPGDWSAAMLSLASAALGFLIGKNDSSPIVMPAQGADTGAYDPCAGCPGYIGRPGTQTPVPPSQSDGNQVMP